MSAWSNPVKKCTSAHLVPGANICTEVHKAHRSVSNAPWILLVQPVLQMRLHEAPQSSPELGRVSRITEMAVPAPFGILPHVRHVSIRMPKAVDVVASQEIKQRGRDHGIPRWQVDEEGGVDAAGAVGEKLREAGVASPDFGR
ncbi:hypothetical protein CERSUDRAFT_119030 [Gelatoporia subvermispora B]|uniref:Uncharacterized protein n=1 Tax=Ceriporiopsis subvermispora (strain B) TaxID=914234 RepID=M2P9B4_CERS8|nr:hypothetical protein CERSUDRAFT_119030 [Gelatoporia subvermispora B]